jgi:putative drug exporter of the RND superfamily
MPRPPGLLARLALLSHRRRGLMVLAWLAVLAAAVVLLPRIAGDYTADYATPGSESKAAADLVAQRFPGRSTDTIDVVWEAPAGVSDPAIQTRMRSFLARASALEGVGVAEPARVSPDGTIGIARLELDRPAWDVPNRTGTRLIDMAEAASGNGLRIELGGGPIKGAEGGASPEMVGLIAAALVLLLAFGSIIAVGLPLVVALVGLGISIALIGVAALAVDVPDWSPAVAGLIGIGVGIDYALLVLTRFRGALHAGAEVRDAIVESVTTAGRSALIAGTTVVVSLLGLFLMGVPYLRGVAIAAGLSVLVVMTAAVTLLPALLSYVGRRVDRLRIPGLARAPRPGREAPAARWSRQVQRRPWIAALAATAVLLALAAPALGLRLGFPDAGNDRAGTTTREAYDLVTRGFGPGANGPLLVAADLTGASGASGAIDGLAQRLRAEPGVAFVSPAQLNPARDAALLVVVPTTSPQDTSTRKLIDRLRDDVVPSALAGSGVRAVIGGATAGVGDQSEYVSGRLPLFIAGVVLLSFLLLLAAFRSPVIALKAGLMNLLSIGAAYGVVALVAGGGWAGSLIGIDTSTPVPPFIPVMMFAILFGLSMDYEVFLLSRVREEFLGHGHTGRAVTDGLARTARVITAAAAIMVAVFLAFAFSPESFLKLMGVGMATAILVDATIVRLVLVPAVMQLMGRANWWIPRWLDRILPRLDMEPARTAAEKPSVPAPAPATSER